MKEVFFFFFFFLSRERRQERRADPVLPLIFWSVSRSASQRKTLQQPALWTTLKDWPEEVWERWMRGQGGDRDEGTAGNICPWKDKRMWVMWKESMMRDGIENWYKGIRGPIGDDGERYLERGTETWKGKQVDIKYENVSYLTPFSSTISMMCKMDELKSHFR